MKLLLSLFVASFLFANYAVAGMCPAASSTEGKITAMNSVWCGSAWAACPAIQVTIQKSDGMTCEANVHTSLAMPGAYIYAMDKGLDVSFFHVPNSGCSAACSVTGSLFVVK